MLNEFLFSFFFTLISATPAEEEFNSFTATWNQPSKFPRENFENGKWGKAFYEKYGPEALGVFERISPSQVRSNILPLVHALIGIGCDSKEVLKKWDLEIPQDDFDLRYRLYDALVLGSCTNFLFEDITTKKESDYFLKAVEHSWRFGEVGFEFWKRMLKHSNYWYVDAAVQMTPNHLHTSFERRAFFSILPLLSIQKWEIYHQTVVRTIIQMKEILEKDPQLKSQLEVHVDNLLAAPRYSGLRSNLIELAAFLNPKKHLDLVREYASASDANLVIGAINASIYFPNERENILVMAYDSLDAMAQSNLFARAQSSKWSVPPINRLITDLKLAHYAGDTQGGWRVLGHALSETSKGPHALLIKMLRGKSESQRLAAANELSRYDQFLPEILGSSEPNVFIPGIQAISNSENPNESFIRIAFQKKDSLSADYLAQTLIVLAKRNNPLGLKYLKLALSEKESVAVHYAYHIVDVPPFERRDELIQMILRHPGRRVREMITCFFQIIPRPEAEYWINEFIKSEKDPKLIQQAVFGIIMKLAPWMEPHLKELWSRLDTSQKLNVLERYQIHQFDVVPFLDFCAADENPIVRAKAEELYPKALPIPE
jgi:hypothetical protein